MYIPPFFTTFILSYYIIKTDTPQFNKIREIFTKDDIMNMNLEYLIRLVI